MGLCYYQIQVCKLFYSVSLSVNTLIYKKKKEKPILFLYHFINMFLSLLCT